MSSLLALGAWLAISLAAGGIGAFASASAPAFYGDLVRPAWAPPAWLFGPVWSVLYVMMGTAAWLVWRERGRRPGVDRALGLYLVQLVLNALWTFIFFAWRKGGLALAEILLLAALIAVTALWFGRIRRSAGLLLLPYLAWVLYATALTAALWLANPSVL